MTADLFFDSSALSKHYHPEPATPVVDALLATAGRVHISRLTRVELHSVFAKKVRTGAISSADLRLLLTRFRADIRAKRFAVARLTVGRFDDAERLIERVGPSQNLRTLDAIQLAAALHLCTPTTPVTFVSADIALCAVAALEGLAVVNPEQP
jgi:predicted nucleic acid-binding protein